MSKADDTTVNWQPYEAEILSLYLHQNWTLEATRTHMREKYGLHATEKQYKTKFLGYKNMKAPEWALVGQEVRKRALEGKDSDLYLCGRQLAPKRVKTGITRHQSMIPEQNPATALGTSCQDRIYIRTPPAATASPLPSQASVEQPVNLDMYDDFFPDVNMGVDSAFSDLGGELYHFNSRNLVGFSPQAGEIIIEESYYQHTNMIQISPLIENCDFDILPYINDDFELIKNLPWFQLQNLLETPGHISLSPVINEYFRPSLQPSSLFGAFNFNRTNLALDERRKILSGFLSSSTKKQVQEYIPHFTSNLQRFVPERQEGELSMKVQQLFAPSNRHPLYQILEIATYFSSNNLFTETQVDVFLRWIIDQKYVDVLKSFLKIRTPTIQAFTTRILESGIRIKDTEFLQLLMTSGIKFDGVIEQAIQLNDLQFLTLLLRTGVDSRLLSGTSGGRLLIRIASSNHTQIARILIENGADVNLPVGGDIYETALYRAVAYGSDDMVKCLIDTNASLHTWSHHEPRTVLGRAVFGCRLHIVVALLEKGAIMDNCTIFGKDLLQWSSLNARDIYQVLLGNTDRGGQHLAIGDITYAAEKGEEAFSHFLCRHQARLSKKILQEALKETVSRSNFRAAIALLDNGVDPDAPTLDKDDRPIMQTDDIDFIQLLINAGASVNLPGLLASFAESQEFDSFNLLIEAGADLEIYGPEALEAAAKEGEIEMAALLLDKGTAINAFGKKLTGLQAASSIEFAQYMIERGADVNAPAYAVNGRTALQAAAEMGDVEMVTFLVDKHANVNAPPAPIGGLTALEAAIASYESTEIKDEIFKFLLENGASINRPGGQGNRGTTILHDLIQQNEDNLVHLAIEAGAYVNCMSSIDRGRTPLQLGAGKGNLDIVKLLLAHGAEVNAPPAYRFGRTALQAAASSELPNLELIQLLIDKQANINDPAGVTGGITALQGAAIRGHINIALLLYRKGADVNARPAFKDGRTAIEGAAEHGRLDMVDFLLKVGAKGDVMRKTGFKRAIELAEKNRHFAIAEMLKARQME